MNWLTSGLTIKQCDCMEQSPSWGFSLFCSVLPAESLDSTMKNVRYPFLTSVFQFTAHLPFYHSTPYRLNYWHHREITHQKVYFFADLLLFSAQQFVLTPSTYNSEATFDSPFFAKKGRQYCLIQFGNHKLNISADCLKLIKWSQVSSSKVNLLSQQIKLLFFYFSLSGCLA